MTNLARRDEAAVGEGPPAKNELPAGDPRAFRRRLLSGAAYNVVFAAFGAVLLVLQNILVMRILGPEDIGLFAAAAAVAFALEALSDFGVGDRLVQVPDAELKRSFDLAVTTQAVLGLALALVIVLIAPVVSSFLDLPRLSPLMMAMSYSAFGGLLRLPLSLLYRDMRYFEQRVLILLGRVVGFIVTVGMALAGTGVWSLAIGGACGLAATGLAAWLYAGDWPRPGFDRNGVSALLQFSWPLWSSRAMIVAADQGSVLTLALLLAIRDVGQFRSAEQLLYTCVWLDIILGQAIFPGLCRVKDSPSQTRDIFEKASRVAMLWAAGGGVAAILFANDLIRFVLTDKWLGSELFLRAQAVSVIISTIGYSWDTLYKARGTTMPVLRWSVIFCASFFLIFPLLTLLRGREGAALSVILIALVGMAVRRYYVHRIGAGISFTEIARRPLAAAFLASLPILAMKGLAASSDLFTFVGAVGLFVLIYVGAVLWLERELLRNGLALIRQGAPEGGR